MKDQIETEIINMKFILFIAATLFPFRPLAENNVQVEVKQVVSVDPKACVYSYGYTVENPPENALDGDPDLIFDFLVSLPPAPGLSGIVTPVGWSAAESAGQIDWTAEGPSAAILPGDSLTFGFLSALPPADTGFNVLVLNASGTPKLITKVGQGPGLTVHIDEKLCKINK